MILICLFVYSCSPSWILITRSIAYGVNETIDLQEKIKSLPLEKVEALGEDLLDFSQSSDWLEWFKRN
jgi:Domain of unknown function (DUF4351)